MTAVLDPLLTDRRPFARSILMLSLHGYVSAEPRLGRPDTGGQVVFILELAKRLARLGCRIDIVTRRFEDQPEFDDIAPGLRVWRLPFGGPDFIRKEDMHDHLAEFVAVFLAHARAQPVDYEVVSSHYWDAGWAGQRIAEELRIPHVHTPHSLGSWKREGMRKEGRQDASYRYDERIRKEFLIYHQADHVIATSPEQIDILRDEYGVPESHMSLIPPGIDESTFTPELPVEVERTRERLGFAPHDIYAVGRAARNKGYDLLIRTLPMLREMVPDARLQLAIGADSDEDRALVNELRNLAAACDVAEHVRWHSYVADEEMPAHYRAAGVFALPSRYEPVGMTAIEAMACGTPTVITTHGGLHQMVEFGKHALYAAPDRPQEYAAMLAMPLQYDRLRERLATEGARFARRWFGWTGIAERTLTVFEQFRGLYSAAGAAGDAGSAPWTS